PPFEEQCPMQQPNEGDSCYVDPALRCSFVTGYCCGTPNGFIDFSCQGFAWHSTGGSAAGSCVPPPPDCPPSPPQEGPACCFVWLNECYYPGCTFGGDHYAKCDGTAWHVSIAPCNPPGPWVDAGPPPIVDASPVEAASADADAASPESD